MWSDTERYVGSSPPLHTVISHYSRTTAVNSLLPASSHGWSICTTSATWTWTHTHALLLCGLNFPFVIFCFLTFLLLLAPCSFFLSPFLHLSLYVGVCPWEVQSARERWQAINSLKDIPRLSLPLRQYLCNMFYRSSSFGKWRQNIMFVIKGNNLMCEFCL